LSEGNSGWIIDTISARFICQNNEFLFPDFAGINGMIFEELSRNGELISRVFFKAKR